MESEYNAGEYTPLEIRRFPARTLRETAEGKYWKRFQAPVLAKQVGPLTAAFLLSLLPSTFKPACVPHSACFAVWASHQHRL